MPLSTSGLPLKAEFREFIGDMGIETLYPPQKMAFQAGVAQGKSIVLCTPTASGKTLTSMIAAFKALENGGKILYVTPLKALAQEKHDDFKPLEKLGYKVILEVGDLDSSHVRKRDYDVMIATGEKADSILRSDKKHFMGLSVLILDEVHLIHSNRGPVYEVITAKLRNMIPDLQVLGLSATIGNAKELADWLDAELVESDWRPVDLTEKVESKKALGLRGAAEKSLRDGQVLVFVNSRRSAEASAEKLGNELKLEGDEETAGKVLNALSSPTRQCKRLAGCIRNGTAFHHAGLVYKQRTAVEDAFREGKIRLISATPTLAAGVNLPSRTVIIRDLKRYGEDGLQYIPVLEYKQQVGRAGRPKYDDAGIAVSLALNDDEEEFIREHYINGEPEPIYSRLGSHPVLRFHVLAAIASNFTRTQKALNQFIASTFFGHQYGVAKDLEALLEQILGELADWEFIICGQYIRATALGQRVSQLYIDPLTAHRYLELLPAAKPTPIGLFEILCEAAEVRKLRIKRNEERRLWDWAYSMESELSRDLGGFDLDWEFLDRFKTALMFTDWTQEKSEEDILEQYNVTPGHLYQQLTNMDWLTYGAAELARIKKLSIRPHLLTLGVQVKYGVGKELLPLVEIRGVGRVRARKLYMSGYASPEDIKKAPKNDIKNLVGEKTAEKILRQI